MYKSNKRKASKIPIKTSNAVSGRELGEAVVISTSGLNTVKVNVTELDPPELLPQIV